MALDNAARYRVGFQYYLKHRVKAAWQINGVTNLTSDPTVTLPTDLVGICSKPSWNQNDNLQPVTGIGAGRALAFTPGRRECDVATRILVANPAFLYYALRNHATPGATKGMTPLDLTWGTCSDYTGDGQTKGAVDAQFNNLTFEVSENQPMTAQADLWPMAFCDADPQALATAVPTSFDAVPIIWQGVSWGPSSGGVISTDYHPRLSQVRFQLGHALQRVGARKAYGTGGVEYNMSRTPYAIVPTVETVRISYQLHDQLPSSMWPVFDQGQITLYGEAVGFGAGRHWLSLRIDNNYMDRRSSGEIQANAMYTASAEMVGHAVTLIYGVTS